MVEIGREVFEKVAFIRIITIAVNRFTSEMRFIMLQLVFNVDKLGVPLVLFRFFSGVKVSVLAHTTIILRGVTDSIGSGLSRVPNCGGSATTLAV